MSVQIVVDVKALLIGRGQRWETNEDAAQITWRVAWILRDQGAQLVVKTPAQNGAVYQGVKYSHDVIAFPSGWIDCLGSAGPPDNGNVPAWNPTGSSGAPLAPPFDLDAGVSLPPVVVDPTPPVLVPPVDAFDLAGALMGLRFQLQAIGDKQDALHQTLSDLVEGLAHDRLIIDAINARQQRGLVIPYLGTAKPPA
jgi:hypothetical protein